MKRYASGLAVFLMLALPAIGKAEAPKGMGEVGEVKSGIAGKVVETMNGGEYTYVLLEKDGQKAWAACPATTVKVGETIAFLGCTPMADFTSKALSRTFDTIMFCSQPMSQQASEILTKKSSGSNIAVPELKEKIATATAPNAYTVADLFAKRSELDNKPVVVKGKVMKFSSGIMRRNWLHIQDGTGSGLQKNNDLVVTTNDTAKVGDVVTVSGTVAKNKDFGSGYKYDVIVEQATVEVQ